MRRSAVLTLILKDAEAVLITVCGLNVSLQIRKKRKVIVVNLGQIEGIYLRRC
jgi:hypothetical protein